MSPDVKFKVVDAAPTTVEVEYEGKPYFVRIALGVLNVRRVGETLTPTGLPVFEVNAGLSLSVEEKG